MDTSSTGAACPNWVSKKTVDREIPMMFLGRTYFPIDPPAALEPVANALPLTQLNEALRGTINHVAGPVDRWQEWAVLTAWTVVGFAVSARLFRWQ